MTDKSLLRAAWEAGALSRDPLSDDMAQSFEEWLEAITARVPEPDPAPPLVFSYRNYRGEMSMREVLPISIRFGATEYHHERQWILLAYDLGKKANREFAMRDITLRFNMRRVP